MDGNPLGELYEILDHLRSMVKFHTGTEQRDYVLMIRSDNGDVLLKEMTTENMAEERTNRLSKRTLRKPIPS